MDKQEILDEIRNSPFSLPCSHSSDVHLKRLLKSILGFTNDGEDENIEDVFKAVPSFQRDNDKWTVEMQHDFIKNIIKGLRTTIMLYEVNEDASKYNLLTNCYILDGLQRITAIYAFITGKFTVFGKTYQEMLDESIISATSMPITLKIFSFPNESEVIKFYISMNKGMTHSNEDIKKAKDILDAIDANK